MDLYSILRMMIIMRDATLWTCLHTPVAVVYGKKNIKKKDQMEFAKNGAPLLKKILDPLPSVIPHIVSINSVEFALAVTLPLLL